MKKYFNFLLSFFCLLILNQSNFIFGDDCNKCVTSDCPTDSKTFFRTRSIIEDVSLFLGLNQYNYYRRYFEPDACDSKDERIHIAVGTFFEQSRCKSKNNVGNFFFSGSADENNEEPEPNATESIITVDPERKIAGAYFDYHQDFCFCDGLWLDVKFAIYQATHNLHAKEKFLRTVTETDCTPLAFMSSDELKFGRISCSELKKVGFDDIEVKLGYYPFNCNENGYLGLYASAILPIADRPSASYLFEPLVGRGHWGLGVGANAAYNVYRCENSAITILTDLSYQYLFKKCELRSLDFKQGQLTRFVVLNAQNSVAQGVPAINLTTLNLQVEPRGVINFWLASHLQYCRWHAEVGYNLWWRQSEKVCFPQKCKTTNFDSLGFFDEDNTFIPLTLDNLDLASTANPRTLTNKIYLALSYDVEACCRPINIGLGGSYEFSRNINAMEQWGVWVNIETSF